MNNIATNNWFAIQVRPRQEKAVAVQLRYKGYEDFLPLCRLGRRMGRENARREIPLFPGYVFCRVVGDEYGLIVTTPGVIRFVGGRQPVPADDSEIAALQQAVSAGLPMQPWPAFQTGDPVELTEGPLRGCYGVLVDWKDERQVVLTISLLGRAVVVQVEHGWVQLRPAWKTVAV